MKFVYMVEGSKGDLEPQYFTSYKLAKAFVKALGVSDQYSIRQILLNPLPPMAAPAPEEKRPTIEDVIFNGEFTEEHYEMVWRDVRITLETDYDSDTSWLGTLWEPSRNNGGRYTTNDFVAGLDEKRSIPARYDPPDAEPNRTLLAQQYSEQGMSRHEAWLKAETEWRNWFKNCAKNIETLRRIHAGHDWFAWLCVERGDKIDSIGGIHVEGNDYGYLNELLAEMLDTILKSS